MEGVLEGRELAWGTAPRRDDLVPAVGTAVDLGMAGSRTGSGDEVDDQQPRPEQEAAYLWRASCRRLWGLVQGALEACTALHYWTPRGPPQGRSGNRAEDEQDQVSGPNLDTHRDRRSAC